MSDLDYQQLDEVIHSRIRLAIMAALIAVEDAEFTFLRNKINTTDGNLSIQLRKLEEAGYVSTQKRFINRKPVTRSKLTAKGKRAFELYIKRIEEFLKQANVEKENAK